LYPPARLFLARLLRLCLTQLIPRYVIVHGVIGRAQKELWR
jgi:hypothetical protein